MGIIAWIIFGLIAGAIAKLIMPGNDGGGFILTCTVFWSLSWAPLWCWAYSGYCDEHKIT